ncbi:hypothetical protein [Fusobacterium gastrosuis]|uniref:hypothetical protein n=1 Tax=Fusobacterium gastrosuis TaxID=1755100 RepID=UPI002A9D7C9C|nr:hypothetical protein [Fusobacterium gastrosuis]
MDLKESVITATNKKGKIKAQILIDWESKEIKIVKKSGIYIYETKEKGLNLGNDLIHEKN